MIRGLRIEAVNTPFSASELRRSRTAKQNSHIDQENQQQKDEAHIGRCRN